MNGINYTNHSLRRMSERKITKNDIQICIQYGYKIHRTGIRYYVILNKQIIENNLPEKFNGLCALVSNDGTLITTFKNKDALNHIRRLSKMDLKKLSSHLA